MLEQVRSVIAVAVAVAVADAENRGNFPLFSLDFPYRIKVEDSCFT